MRRPPHRLALAGIAVLAIPGVAACSNGTSTAVDLSTRPTVDIDRPAAATVTVAHRAFTPNRIEIPAGETVAWTWDDHPMDHDVVLDNGTHSPQQDEGTWTHTFNDPGTYPYACSLHPDMAATVIVVE